MKGARKIGDWDKVGRITHDLAKDMEDAREESLKKWGLKAEGTAKKHMGTQDLGWTSLKPATISAKVRKGYSENILIATSDYFQAITSWVGKGTAYVGVTKHATDSDGTKIADIAAVHEFGSKGAGIPKRPLWKPTFKETVKWFNKSSSTPAKIFMRKVKLKW